MGLNEAKFSISSNGGTKEVIVKASRKTPAKLVVQESEIDFGKISTKKTLTLSNTGQENLTWEIEENLTWLSATPKSGTNDQEVTLTIDRSNVTKGQGVRGNLTVKSNGGEKIVLIKAVKAAAAQLFVSVVDLAFGDSKTETQFEVKNSGGEDLDWQIHESLSWLSVNFKSGTNDQLITVRVDRSQIQKGTSVKGVIQVESDSETKTIEVTAARAGVPTLSVSPTSLAFGDTSTSKTFQISNSGSGDLNWTVSETLPWLSVDSKSGTNGKTITVTVDRTGLSAGVNVSGNITVSSNGGNKTIAVSASKQVTNWDKTFGGNESDIAESLISTSDGGFAIAGRTQSKGAGNSDFWLVKYKRD